jgi:hypothetical protein
MNVITLRIAAATTFGNVAFQIPSDLSLVGAQVAAAGNVGISRDAARIHADFNQPDLSSADYIVETDIGFVWSFTSGLILPLPLELRKGEVLYFTADGPATLLMFVDMV